VFFSFIRWRLLIPTSIKNPNNEFNFELKQRLDFESLGSDGVIVASDGVVAFFEGVLEPGDAVPVACDYRLQFCNILLFVAKLKLIMNKDDLPCAGLSFIRC
jgi:hypothetical protein